MEIELYTFYSQPLYNMWSAQGTPPMRFALIVYWSLVVRTQGLQQRPRCDDTTRAYSPRCETAAGGEEFLCAPHTPPPTDPPPPTTPSCCPDNTPCHVHNTAPSILLQDDPNVSCKCGSTDCTWNPSTSQGHAADDPITSWYGAMCNPSTSTCWSA